ncbi:MAG: phosphopantetheine-binding protein [Proteobacteria bacterium]|nr:phosphopantetheine-binding protein [Pseudomonadota bacterium]
MNRQIILTQLVTTIAGLKRRIRTSDVREDASLADDLGLDSLDLAALSSAIRHEFNNLDLAGWYMAVASSGTDTVGSLVDYIIESRSSAPSQRSK